MISSRQTRFISFLAVLGLGLAWCGTALASTFQRSSEPDSSAFISVNNVEPVSYLLPGNIGDTAGWKVATQLFEGLVTFSPKGDLVYANADSITPNQDASSYTITLKPGLKFSNGESITASTYARSWSFAANAANGQLGSAIFSTIAGYDQLQDSRGPKDALLPGLRVVDDATLRVQLAGPDSSFPYKVGDVAFMPLPSAAYADPVAFGKHPIGNGPYLFQSWIPNQSISLVKNPTYSGPRKAHNLGIIFRNYESLDTAYADVEAGNLDVLDSVPVSSLGTYRSDKTVQAYSSTGPALKTMTIPSDLPHFEGREGVLRRQALSATIDRAKIREKIFRGSVVVASDFTAPTIEGHTDSLAGEQVLAHHPAQARKLWQEANTISPWTGSFEIAYAADSGDKDWVDAVTHYIEGTLGIHAHSTVFPTAKEFRTSINKRQVHAAFSSGIQSDYPHPEGYLVQGYASWFADGKGLNHGDYKSSDFDAFLRRAAEQTDSSEAGEYYHRAQERLLHDLPALPLWYTKVSAAASQRMQTVRFSYMGLPAYSELVKSAQ
ncbi:ABC transporter substrate-binding protein [Bombiscardovia apis]|uniref:ABC transporter substrate-binding protein n=1 Tax=Bombiscardovia apis TaxID=2932182 RepID=A0ABN6SH01_9BIFI|nr:ABC transporter substrate-binding protein [Bombiscardovia apis]BDR55029.1 ABC transporter substrate-binding protein [Bombiscardovia apis]